ncbi:hypothetical protein [Nostoc sp.]
MVIRRSSSLTPEQVQAGTGKVRSYEDWETILKRPEFGVSDLFAEVKQG